MGCFYTSAHQGRTLGRVIMLLQKLCCNFHALSLMVLQGMEETGIVKPGRNDAGFEFIRWQCGMGSDLFHCLYHLQCMAVVMIYKLFGQ